LQYANISEYAEVLLPFSLRKDALLRLEAIEVTHEVRIYVVLVHKGPHYLIVLFSNHRSLLYTPLLLIALFFLIGSPHMTCRLRL
jgi:hypothetical protein